MQKKRKYKPGGEKKSVFAKSAAPYLVIDSSFQDQENANYMHWIRLTPEERIAEASYLINTLLIGKIKKIKNSRIIIDKYE